MNGACRVNNMTARSIRRTDAYQCLVVDLAMLGVISREECEMLIGCGIPKGMALPNGMTYERIVAAAGPSDGGGGGEAPGGVAAKAKAKGKAT